MSLIALDASGSQASLVLLSQDGTLEGRWTVPLKPGLIESLPVLLQQAVPEGGITDVAVCIGPGSFTGLRTSIALAQGFASGLGVTLWGIPVWDAYHEALKGLNRPLWVAIRARRGRLFLMRHEGKAEAFPDDALPMPETAVALAGDEADSVAASLAAHGADVLLTDVRSADAAYVGLAALAHKQAGHVPLAALPLYVDPPEAKLPASGLRPAPV